MVPPPPPINLPAGRLLLLWYLRWLAEEPLLDKDAVSLRFILEWMLSNPPLVDIRKLHDWSLFHSSTETIAFGLSLIEKSEGKRQQRSANVASFRAKQHNRFVG